MSDGGGRSNALSATPTVAIPRHELSFRATRAGGPGGQHVNKTATRVELIWNVESSRALSDEERARVRRQLGSRIDSQGNIRVTASAFRSQLRNREDAESRLVALLRRGLAVPKTRRKTKPSSGAIRSRLDAKRRLSEKKRERRRQDADSD